MVHADIRRGPLAPLEGLPFANEAFFSGAFRPEAHLVHGKAKVGADFARGELSGVFLRNRARIRVRCPGGHPIHAIAGDEQIALLLVRIVLAQPLALLFGSSRNVVGHVRIRYAHQHHAALGRFLKSRDGAFPQPGDGSGVARITDRGLAGFLVDPCGPCVKGKIREHVDRLFVFGGKDPRRRVGRRRLRTAGGLLRSCQNTAHEQQEERCGGNGRRTKEGRCLAHEFASACRLSVHQQVRQIVAHIRDGKKERQTFIRRLPHGGPVGRLCCRLVSGPRGSKRDGNRRRHRDRTGQWTVRRDGVPVWSSRVIAPSVMPWCSA